MYHRSTLLVAALFILPLPLFGGPLEQATITRIINDVRVVDPRKGSHEAAVQEIIKDDLAVKTGIRSRAELLFQDNTLSRLGAETFFAFRQGTREISLERGTLLLQVPKGVGGAKIKTAAVTASITGTTIMMEHIPGQNLKVVVLEGSLRLSLNNRIGESLSLTPGKMIIMKPDARAIPEPVAVDIKSLVKTSALINEKGFKGAKGKSVAAALPSAALIEKEIAQQEKGKGKGKLVPTNLMILGKGTKVTAASDAMIEKLDRAFSASAGKEGRDGDLAAGRRLDFLLGRAHPGTAPEDERGDGGRPTRNAPKPAATPPRATPAPATPLPKPVTRPNWAATAPPGPAPAPLPGSHEKPVLIASPDPYPLIDSEGNSDILLKSKDPHIKTGGGSKRGTIYGGSNVDGSAAAFLFDSQSDFDAKTNFDARLGRRADGSFASSGIAVFRFSGLEVGGSPTINITPDGPVDLALVSETQITNTGAPVNLIPNGGLASLFLGTVNGPITFTKDLVISAPAASGFRTLHLYSRGSSGTISIDSQLLLPSADVFVDAEAAVLVGVDGTVNASRAVFNSAQNMNVNGAITAGLVQLEAQQDLTISGIIKGGRVLGFGNDIFVIGGHVQGQDLSLVSNNDLTFGSNPTIAGTTVHLSAGGKFQLTGSTFDAAQTRTLNITAGSVDMVGLSFAVPATTSAAIVTTAGKLDATGGNLTGFQVLKVTGGDLLANDIAARTISIESGKIDSSGNLAASVTTASGDVLVGGEIRAGSDGKHVLTAAKIVAGAGINASGAPGTSAAGGVVELHAESLDIKAGGIAGVNLNGGDAKAGSTREGGDGGRFDAGTTAQPVVGTINVESPITATTGANAAGISHGGKGGTVSLVAEETITVKSEIKVSDNSAGRASKTSGSISIESRKATGTAINIENTGQLHALLAGSAPGPGGTIKFVTSGGDILVTGGKVRADRGTVDIRNNGSAGIVSLNNATLSGDVVKIATFGKDGRLNIGGGSIDANSAIKLYAPGSNGEVRFTGDVTLSGRSTKTIAGNSVTIDNGVLVNVDGRRADVFTNNANYTGSGGNANTTGRFGGSGANAPKPLNSAPAF